VHIHSGAEPVKLFYELEPSLTIIWAHAGMSEPPEVVGPMMDRYATLYADTSYRERDILDGSGGIDPAWRQVITKHADRFMVGSDTWVNSQWDNYEDLIKTNRDWLRHFPKAIAEKIAFGNAERLFQRKVARELVGVR
jgi:predicted TIM-barrel fold metal-dependent hydrolase